MYTPKQRAYYNKVQRIIVTGLTAGDGIATGQKILNCRKAAQAKGLTLAECKEIENEALNTTAFLHAYAAHEAKKGN